MRIGVQDHAGGAHPGDMAAPEEQISTLLGYAFGQVGSEGAFLQVAVAGAGVPACVKGELDKARTIDTSEGIAAPEVRRAEQGLGDSDRVGAGLVNGAQMLFGQPVAIMTAQEVPFAPGDAEARIERKRVQGRGLGIRGSVKMRRAGADSVGDFVVGAMSTSSDPAAISIILGLDKAPVVAFLDHNDAGPEQELAVKRAIRYTQQISKRRLDPGRSAVGELRRLDLAAQAGERHCPAERGQAPVGHRSSRRGRAA